MLILMARISSSGGGGCFYQKTEKAIDTLFVDKTNKGKELLKRFQKLIFDKLLILEFEKTELQEVCPEEVCQR